MNDWGWKAPRRRRAAPEVEEPGPVYPYGRLLFEIGLFRLGLSALGLAVLLIAGDASYALLSGPMIWRETTCDLVGGTDSDGDTNFETIPASHPDWRFFPSKIPGQNGQPCWVPDEPDGKRFGTFDRPSTAEVPLLQRIHELTWAFSGLFAAMGLIFLYIWLEERGR